MADSTLDETITSSGDVVYSQKNRRTNTFLKSKEECISEIYTGMCRQLSYLRVTISSVSTKLSRLLAMFQKV
jgi:hypothetical protein